MVTNEKTWSAGLKAWNERCEAQGLGRGCDTETRDAKLEAILHSGVRGCFFRLSQRWARQSTACGCGALASSSSLRSITELNLE